jgi:chromosomal replication initiation ATPase DnaA
MSNHSYHYTSYHDLQNVLDELIGKIGLDKTIKLMRQIMNNGRSGLTTTKDEKTKLITSYIISRCVSVFDLDEGQFTTSQIREYREGRMACYHLLKKYTDCSYPRIAQLFSQKRRNVLYYCQKCDEILSIPQFQKVFAEKYNTLEGYTVEFIAAINANNIL